MAAGKVKQKKNVKNRVKNNNAITRSVSLSKLNHKEIVHVDFTKYPNWCISCECEDFTNFYKDDKHVHNVLSNILRKLLPHIQNNISKIIMNKEKHCHLLRGDALEKAVKAINSVHGASVEQYALWQFGVANGVRVIGVIVSHDFYTLYPLLIDCNHLLIPDINFNNKDFKRYKHTIRD